MSREVFHEIKSASVTFTEDEWSEYLRRCREDESQRIVTQIGRYDFNDRDVCLNPEVLTIVAKTGSYGYQVTLKWAECRNGIWSYAVDYNCGTGGGGSGVHYADTLDGKSWMRGYPSEREAQQAACDEAIRQVRTMRDGKSVLGDRLVQMIEDYQKTISRPKIVELSLFSFMLPPKETCDTCKHNYKVCVCNNTRPVYIHYCDKKYDNHTQTKNKKIKCKNPACGWWERKEK